MTRREEWERKRKVARQDAESCETVAVMASALVTYLGPVEHGGRAEMLKEVQYFLDEHGYPSCEFDIPKALPAPASHGKRAPLQAGENLASGTVTRVTAKQRSVEVHG